MLFDWGKRRDSATHNSSIWLCQGCSGQFRVTSMIKLSLFLLLKELSLSTKKREIHRGVPLCPSFVGKCLLLGSEDMASISCVLRSDGKLCMETDLFLDYINPGLSYEIFLATITIR